MYEENKERETGKVLVKLFQKLVGLGEAQEKRRKEKRSKRSEAVRKNEKIQINIE